MWRPDSRSHGEAAQSLRQRSASTPSAALAVGDSGTGPASVSRVQAGGHRDGTEKRIEHCRSSSAARWFPGPRQAWRQLRLPGRPIVVITAASRGGSAFVMLFYPADQCQEAVPEPGCCFGLILARRVGQRAEVLPHGLRRSGQATGRVRPRRSQRMS